MLSLRKTAKRHDINPGYLSQRVREGKPAKGHDLTKYVRLDEDGGVLGFVFPPGYRFPVPPQTDAAGRENPQAPSAANTPTATNTITEQVQAVRPRRKSGNRAVQTPGASSGEANDWQGEATRAITSFFGEQPGQVAAASLEGAKLFGATLAAVGTAKYVYDSRQEAPAVRANPKGEEAARQQVSLWPVLGTGAAVFIGADYGLRGDESLLVRAARWTGKQLDRLSDSGSAEERERIGDGERAAWPRAAQPHSGDGATSPVPDLEHFWKN